MTELSTNSSLNKLKGYGKHSIKSSTIQTKYKSLSTFRSNQLKLSLLNRLAITKYESNATYKLLRDIFYQY